MLNNSSLTRKKNLNSCSKTHFQPLNSTIFLSPSILVPKSRGNEFYPDMASPNSGLSKVMLYFAFHRNIKLQVTALRVDFDKNT